MNDSMDRSSVPDCGHARRMLSARHDGEPHGDAAFLDAHVARCPACAAFARRLEELSAGFGALRTLEAPPDLLRRVQPMHPGEARIRPSTAASARPGPWLMRAAAALLGFLSVFALARSRSDFTPRASSEGPTVSAPTLFALAGRAFARHQELEALPERAFLRHRASQREDSR